MIKTLSGKIYFQTPETFFPHAPNDILPEQLGKCLSAEEDAAEFSVANAISLNRSPEVSHGKRKSEKKEVVILARHECFYVIKTLYNTLF